MAVVQSPAYHSFVAIEDNGRCVGMLLAAGHERSDSEDGTWLLITSLYTRHRRERRGIGTALVRTALCAARDAGFLGVRLYCFSTNFEGRGLYDKCRFAQLEYIVYQKRCDEAF